MTGDWFDQSAFPVRLEWGWRGAERAAKRGDILVVVDTLSFATTSVTALSRGITLYPCRSQAEAQEIAVRTGAEVGSKRGAARYTMSPLSFLEAPAGIAVALPTPNGATCCRAGQDAPFLFVGTLVNAGAVAEAVALTQASYGNAVTVLACGERWEEAHDDGALRFALEDLLGAGAILSALPTSLTRSPEARAAEAVFKSGADDLLNILSTCGSGVELIDRGYAGDVHLAAQWNTIAIVPMLVAKERLETWMQN